MSDLISRQAAIDALAKAMPSLTTPDGSGAFDHDIQIADEAFVDAMQIIQELPSAQPEPCEDTVSRQRLLSDLKELVAAWKKYPVMAEQIKGVEAAIGYVELIPSAQPEPIKINIDDFNKEDLERFKKELGNTPITVLPAQPEIIRCKDCKHKHVENMVWTCPFGLPGGENFFCGYGTEPYKGEQ